MPMQDCSILVAEDEVAIRKSLGIVLSATGYRVRLADDGFSALREMRHEVPDILLSDLNMPGMSGFELLSVVRRRFPSVQVLAMSGTLADIFAGIAADAFHQKGGNLPSLLMKLEKMAAQRGAVRTREGGNTPKWIPTLHHDHDGRAIVMLSCPECLRTFPHLFADAGLLIHDAMCVHCASVVVYAVVHRSSPEALSYRRMGQVEREQASESILS
jgi:CheY-like chemotaxis protein